MSNTIEFNTGRQYGPDGQVITATVIKEFIDTGWDDEVMLLVKFTDHTRHITQHVILNELSERELMSAYDHALYCDHTPDNYLTKLSGYNEMSGPGIYTDLERLAK